MYYVCESLQRQKHMLVCVCVTETPDSHCCMFADMVHHSWRCYCCFPGCTMKRDAEHNTRWLYLAECPPPPTSTPPTSTTPFSCTHTNTHTIQDSSRNRKRCSTFNAFLPLLRRLITLFSLRVLYIFKIPSKYSTHLKGQRELCGLKRLRHRPTSPIG